MIPFSILARLSAILASVWRCVRCGTGSLVALPASLMHWCSPDCATAVTIQLLLPLDTVNYGAGLLSYIASMWLPKCCSHLDTMNSGDPKQNKTSLWLIKWEPPCKRRVSDMGLISSNVVDIKFHNKTKAAKGSLGAPVLYKIPPKDHLVARNC